jgi:hypothetical protein
VNDYINDIGKWIAGAAAVITGAFALWVRGSRAKLDVRKHEGEGGWISRLERDRDQALERERLAREAHDRDRVLLSEIRTKFELMRQRSERIERELAVLKRIILRDHPELRALIDSEFGNFDDEPSPPKAT